MSDAIPQDQFPPWRAKIAPPMSRAALALGQIEEAIGALDEGGPDCRQQASACLQIARLLLLEAHRAADAVRAPPALLTPITDEEAGT
jgi:hypothetical protein